MSASFYSCRLATYALSSATILELKRSNSLRNPKDRVGHCMGNIYTGLTLGLIAMSAMEVVDPYANTPYSNTVAIALVGVTALSITASLVASGIAQYCTKKNIYPNTLGKSDIVLSKCMIIIQKVSLVAVLLLLVPNAKQDPINFGLSTIMVGANLLT